MLSFRRFNLPSELLPTPDFEDRLRWDIFLMLIEKLACHRVGERYGRESDTSQSQTDSKIQKQKHTKGQRVLLRDKLTI